MAIFGQPVPTSGAEGAATEAPPATEVAPTTEGAPAPPPVDTTTAPAPVVDKQYVDTEAMGGHLVKVKVNGSDVEMPLKDALQGVMRHEDYTRKTQEIAEARRRLNQADALAAALDADPIGTLKQLATAYDVDVENGFQAMEPDPVRDQLRAQEQAIAEMRAASVNQQIQSEVENLRTQYGDFDVQAVANYAVENHMTLTNAYKSMNFDSVRSQQSSTADQNRQRALASGNVEGGSNAQRGSVTENQKPAQSFREAYFQAKRQLGA